MAGVYRSYREAQVIALERNAELSDLGIRFGQINQVHKRSH